MKLTPEKRNNLILTILICTGLIYGAWYGGIKLQQDMQRKDNDEIGRLNDEVKKLKTNIRIEMNNRSAAKVYQEYTAAAEARMPEGNVETWLVRELSGVASKHSLQLLDMTLKDFDEVTDFNFKDMPYAAAEFQFQMKGEYNQIGEFFMDLENSYPLMRVHKLTIRSGSEVAPHVHTVDVTLAVPHKK